MAGVAKVPVEAMGQDARHPRSREQVRGLVAWSADGIVAVTRFQVAPVCQTAGQTDPIGYVLMYIFCACTP